LYAAAPDGNIEGQTHVGFASSETISVMGFLGLLEILIIGCLVWWVWERKLQAKRDRIRRSEEAMRPRTIHGFDTRYYVMPDAFRPSFPKLFFSGFLLIYAKSHMHAWW